LKKLEASEGDTFYEDIEHLKKSVENFNTFYVNMCNMMNLAEEESLEIFKLRFDTFTNSSRILFRIQKYSDLYTIKEMPEWLKMVVECSKIKTRKAKVVLVSIETFLNILTKKTDNSEDPIKYLQQLIVNFDSSVKQEDGKPIYYTL